MIRLLPSKLQDVKLIVPQVHGDHRGFFVESYQQDAFAEVGITTAFIQDNHSRSRQAGTLRGLHFQTPPYAQAKLVRVTSGVIYDVIVDLRVGSPTFGEWEGFILSEHNHRQLFVPQGFAHGFITLTDDVDVHYKVDAPYAAAHDCGIAYDDADLAIDWPMSATVLSDKDRQHPTLAQFNTPFVWKG